jgi:hypothetical protein
MVPINCYRKACFDDCFAESSLQVQCFDDFFQRQLLAADSGVGSAVVYSDVVTFAQQPATEDHVPEEAVTFVAGLRFENRLVCSCDDLPRLPAVQQDRPETVAIISVDSIVNLVRTTLFML